MLKLNMLSIVPSGEKSLIITVPMSILKHFKLEAGDKLDWDFEAKNTDLSSLFDQSKVPMEKAVFPTTQNLSKT